jgi:hypothetical protein
MSIGLLAVVISSQLTLVVQGFQRVAQDHGVTVYRREHVREIDLAAEGDIMAPPERVRQVLLDYSRHPAWVKHLAESRVLEQDAEHALVYQRLDLPILEDRDYTLRVTWGNEGDVLWTRFTTADEKGPPPRHRVVRVQVHEGGWELQPIDGGRGTHARYHFRLDLAGSLPGWMSRSRAGKDVPQLFEALRKQSVAH